MKFLLRGLFGRRKGAIKLATAATSNKGLVRADNQDSFVCLPEEGFLCVADGMGGGEGGAVASKWVCEALSEAWKKSCGIIFEEREIFIENALHAVNERIRAYAREHGYKMMGTTVAAVIHNPNEIIRARIFHVGDSRIYRFRNGRLDSLTRDHTVGNELGTAMLFMNKERAQYFKARSNPLAHVLTRAVGTEMRVRLEWKTLDVQCGDRLLVCSDGVHDMLSDADIASVLKASATPDVAVARIESSVIKAGAGDNYTVICAYVVR